MRRDTRLTSRAERRNRKNVLLIKKPCFLSNINDSMKGFTHNSGYAEFITGAQLHRIVINNFSQLSQPHPFSLLIHNTGSHICLCVCLSLFLTDTHTQSVFVQEHCVRACACACALLCSSSDLFFTFPFNFLWVTSSGGNTLQLYLYFLCENTGLMHTENKSRNLVQCFASLVNSCAPT